MIYKNIEWFYYQGVLLPKTPPHQEITLSKKEERALLKKSKAPLLRYTTEWDRDFGAFWYVIKDTKEGLDTYKSKIRNQIKKGLKYNRVIPVDKRVIIQSGYEIYLEAFKRYNTLQSPMNQQSFCLAIEQSEDEFWAVYYQDKLIAYSQNRIEGESIHYSTIKLHPEYLKYYPSYALFYEMNSYYLNEKNVLYVNDGARSIVHETNIQNFLIEKFKFRRCYVKLHIVYRWDIGLGVKLLFPFRHFIQKVNLKFFQKIAVLLYQEEIKRTYDNAR